MAAGNHSWFLIDEFMPFSYNYKMPVLKVAKKMEKKSLERQRFDDRKSAADRFQENKHTAERPLLNSSNHLAPVEKRPERREKARDADPDNRLLSN